MRTHIRVKQRAEDEGIGHEKVKVEQASTNWWQGAVNDTLAKLNQSGSKKSKKSKKDKSKKKSKVVAQIKTYTDEELFIATGGARFGMRAQRKQEGKWARAEKGISQEEELSAMAAVEWNGTGKAKFASDLLLSGSKKRRGLEVGEQGNELVDRTIDKKRKREISTDDNDDLPDTKTLEDHNNAEIDENKKSKKEKKKKKKKKKKSKQDVSDHSLAFSQ